MFLSTLSAGDGEDMLLRAMFAARKRVFVDLLKWEVPVLAGQYELDQFDDPNATYLILSDAEGGHLGSARLLETERAHILDTLFPELSELPVPRGPAVREITRFCLDPTRPARERRQIRDTLVSALADFALVAGIDTYTGVAELSWLRQILAFGWDCKPLGLPQQFGPAMLGALQIDITPDTPALLARAGIASCATLDRRAARCAA
jgi:N-acyl-L-homoserine lactone synthetase